MWEWRCSACGAKFRDEVDSEAERQFLEHARLEHKPKMIVSVTT